MKAQRREYAGVAGRPIDYPADSEYAAAAKVAGNGHVEPSVYHPARGRPASPGPGHAVLTSDVKSEAGRRPPSAA